MLDSFEYDVQITTVYPTRGFIGSREKSFWKTEYNEATDKLTIKCVKHGGLLRSNKCCSLYTASSSEKWIRPQQYRFYNIKHSSRAAASTIAARKQHVRNDAVRRATKQPRLSATVQSRRLSVFWHSAGMPDKADDRRILKASPMETGGDHWDVLA